MTCNPSLLTPINADTAAIVVGGGRSGQAAARLLRRLGASVRLLEKRPEPLPSEFTVWAEWKSLGENTKQNISVTRTFSFPAPVQPYP